LPSDNATSTPSQRRHDVDGLRTLALGLLIVPHIVISFQPWAKAIRFIQNDQLVEWLWIPMSMVNVWRIPLLFMVSGMGARFAMERRTMVQLLLDRTLRILVPLAFGIFFICPIAVYIFAKYYGTGAGYHPNAGHLWFLINIFCYVLYFLSALWALKEYPENAFLRHLSAKLQRRPWLIYAAAIPVMLEAWIVNPEFFALYPTPHGHFLGTICFGLGILFVSLKSVFWRTVERVRAFSLAMAASLFLVRLFVFELGGVPKPLVAFESMCWMLALLGFASAHFNWPSAWLAYLSKAVYPVYIIHFPVQYAISYSLIPLALPASVKLGVLLVATFGICLPIYEVVLRRLTWIRPLFGMKLNPG
jgi:peptidoglycan/LPS O-acetylase OafA/YrhL